MKNNTKLKIINLVTRILKYHQPINPPPKEEKRQIQIVQWEDSFDAKRPIETDQLNHIISHGIAFEVEKRGAIQVKEEIINDKIIVRARAFFISPPDRWY